MTAKEYGNHLMTLLANLVYNAKQDKNITREEIIDSCQRIIDTHNRVCDEHIK